MDGYQFSASLFQSLTSLAWPAALIVCVWLFRAQLAGLLPNLKVKHKDWEISFRLNEAEKAAANLPAASDSQEPPPPTPEEKSRFYQIAKISPRAAILEMRATLDDGVGVDQQLSCACDEGFIVSFSACDETGLELDQRFVPTEGGRQGCGEQRTA